MPSSTCFRSELFDRLIVRTEIAVLRALASDQELGRIGIPPEMQPALGERGRIVIVPRMLPLLAQPVRPVVQRRQFGEHIFTFARAHALSYRSFHFKLNQTIQFHRVFQRQFLGKRLHEAVDDQAAGRRLRSGRGW